VAGEDGKVRRFVIEARVVIGWTLPEGTDPERIKIGATQHFEELGFKVAGIDKVHLVPEHMN
jgi:hypothetical protein